RKDASGDRARHRRDRSRYRTFFTSAQDIVHSLGLAHLDGSIRSKIRSYTGPSVLVVDESRLRVQLGWVLLVRPHRRPSMYFRWSEPQQARS
ncbi:MAG: ATP-binding protein, partial [Vicinamibacterales bacterium]